MYKCVNSILAKSELAFAFIVSQAFMIEMLIAPKWQSTMQVSPRLWCIQDHETVIIT